MLSTGSLLTEAVTYSPSYLVAASFQFPITALREIKILQLLNHENVVNLIEICRGKGECQCFNSSSYYEELQTTCIKGEVRDIWRF